MDRFFVMEMSNESNKIDAVQAAAGIPLVAIVDEEAGGIVAYAAPTFAAETVAQLNYAANPDSETQEEIDATRKEMESKLS